MWKEDGVPDDPSERSISTFSGSGFIGQLPQIPTLLIPILELLFQELI